MAFDPLQEDCHRLILEGMRRTGSSLTDEAFFKKSMDAYREDPSKLIVHDRDRSFHLVAKATELCDYRIPFTQDEAAAERMAHEAEGMLREAVSLDESNWDAQRMLCAITAPSGAAYLTYLEDNVDDVSHALALEVAAAHDDYSREYTNDLARRPYLRWLAALASRSLIAGRYRKALAYARKSLAFAPDDPADVRYTALLALAKLEATVPELIEFRDQHSVAYGLASIARRRQAKNKTDAWMLLAKIAAAYHSFAYDDAERFLRELVRTYPNAAEALYCQTEFPDGLYARVNVVPFSQDEIMLALSEATPLLQEGLGAPDNASFAYWIATNDAVVSNLKDRRLRQDAERAVYRGGEQ